MIVNVLLVSPYHTKYPNLALMKISTYHKRKGDKVFYQKGHKMQDEEPDIIYVSALFTHKAPKTIEVINKYQKWYPDAEIHVGGIYPTLMPDHLEEATGIKPHIGSWEEIDFLPPDYSLFEDHKYSDTSFVFTARGCPKDCDFCAVNTLEPEYKENPNWEESIHPDKPEVMIHDNNMTALDFDHYKDVITTLKEVGKKVTFDNGFDCQLITPEHAEMLSDLRIKRRGIRLAFDTMDQDGYIQNAIKMLRDHGVPKSKIMVYVLFNYKDDLEEALYRANEVRKCDARVYPQRYIPLDWTDNPSDYVSENWNKQMVREFRFYWLMNGINSKMSFEEFLKAGGEKGLTG